MSIKNFLVFNIFFSFTFISPKEENSEKLLYHSLFGISKDIKLFSNQSNFKYINTRCLFAKDYNIYSLQSLQNKDKDYIYEDGNSKIIHFNFCSNTHILNNSTFIQDIKGKLVRLTGSIDGEGEYKNEWNEIDSKKGGLTISFVEGDLWADNTTQRHAFKLTVKCDPEIDGKDFLKTFNIIYSNGCQHTAEMSSVYGCSLRSTYLLLKLFMRFKIFFCILFIIVGLALWVFGNRFINYTIIVICGLAGCYILTSVVLEFFPNFITEEIQSFACLVVFFIVGCLIGYTINNYEKLYIFLLGAGLGYFFAIFVYQIVQNYVDFNPEIVYYACIGVFIVVGAFISWKLTKPIIILATSVFGGFLIIRGISLVVGHYLDEGLVIDLIKNKEWDQLKEMRSGWTYAYLGSWIAFIVAGVFIQCKLKIKK